MNLRRPKSRLAILASALFLYASNSPRAAELASSEAAEFFETHIRPTLMDACLKCHGGEKTSRGLRVDSREALLKGGQSGPAIVPCEPEKSLIIQVIRSRHGNVKM